MRSDTDQFASNPDLHSNLTVFWEEISETPSAVTVGQSRGCVNGNYLNVTLTPRQSRMNSSGLLEDLTEINPSAKSEDCQHEICGLHSRNPHSIQGLHHKSVGFHGFNEKMRIYHG